MNQTIEIFFVQKSRIISIKINNLLSIMIFYGIQIYMLALFKLYPGFYIL